jgi:hypothetical protein
MGPSVMVCCTEITRFSIDHTVVQREQKSYKYTLLELSTWRGHSLFLATNNNFLLCDRLLFSSSSSAIPLRIPVVCIDLKGNIASLSLRALQHHINHHHNRYHEQYHSSKNSTPFPRLFGPRLTLRSRRRNAFEGLKPMEQQVGDGSGVAASHLRDCTIEMGRSAESWPRGDMSFGGVHCRAVGMRSIWR